MAAEFARPSAPIPMKLDAPLIRLPWRFDTTELQESLDRLAPPDSARADSTGATVALLAPDEATGQVRPTAAMEKSPAVAGLLAAPGVVLGPARLATLPPGHSSDRRHDLDAYWQDHGRLVFVLGQSAVLEVGGQRVEAPGGSVWLIDGWRGWRFAAPDGHSASVLLVDTVGSAAFWSMVASADRPQSGDEAPGMSQRSIHPGQAGDKALEQLETERLSVPPIRSTAEIGQLARTVVEEMRESADGKPRALERLQSSIDSFLRQWQAATAQHGDSESGRAACRQALEQVWSQFVQYAHPWRLDNDVMAIERAHALLFSGAMHDAQGRAIEVIPRASLDEILGRPGQSPHARAQAVGPQTPTGQAGGETAYASEPYAGAAPNEPPPAAQAPQAAQTPAGQPQAGGNEPAQQPIDPHAPLRSVHTRSFPQLLNQLGASLLVTTYQAGKLAILRENNGGLNTHFHVYNRPMGLAYDRKGRLAVGTAWTVEEYRNMVDVARQLEPQGRHDAAYLPRNIKITGNIDIHEMAFGDEGLWLVNTRFSCLCTLDDDHSFVPRWRPKFISGYAPEDRCHLNGLEIVDGKPKYVTALGSTDRAGGWRDNKAGGGIIMDVESGEIICRGLSMPHSPRLYDGKLWVLESGNGSLAKVDPATGQVDTVVELPGFTRGLDFLGPFAFIGLSQVRESAVFSGIRLTERVDERNCGVWVVDLRTAKVVAFLKFEDAVQEVFAVSVLAGQRFPDVLGVNDPRIPISYALPDEALAEVVRTAAD